MLVTLFLSTKTKHSHSAQTRKEFLKSCLKMKKNHWKRAQKSQKATLLILFQARPWINNLVN